MARAESVTLEWVRSMAANPSAFSNAQRISRIGGFQTHFRSEDDTLLFGTCKGSGRSAYQTSVDFSGDTPVFRCSCPSRQIPCKHGIAILLDYLEGKPFEPAEIPEDVQRKREKLEKRAEKAAQPEPAKRKPSGASAAAKKLKRQLEGLELAEQFVRDLLERGISSIHAVTAKQYLSLAKQMGDYALYGPQTIMLELIAKASACAENPDDAQMEQLVTLCVRLNAVVQKSKRYLQEKLESGEVLPDGNVLYEAVGNVWKLTQLQALGLCRNNARLVQLSFAVLPDEQRQADVDFGYWCDLDTGEIVSTQNIRPYRAGKHIKEEDSMFGLYQIPTLCRYPGGSNPRVRWEQAEVQEFLPAHCATIRNRALPTLGEAVKQAKAELKNTMAPEALAVLLAFDTIQFAQEDGHGVMQRGAERIALRSNASYPATCEVLHVLDKPARTDGALLGEMFYSSRERRFFLCPISIVTETGIIRLC